MPALSVTGACALDKCEELVEKTGAILARLSKNKFFGKVTISFQDGIIKSCKVEKTLNSEELLKSEE